jgi:hypothetical protein
MRAIAIIVLLFTSQVFSNINIQTLDSWTIQSYTPDALMVRKDSELNDNYLAFEMSRPFCICEDLSFIIYQDNEFKDKQEIEGKLSFNFLRSKKVTYKVYHADRDWFVLRLKNFPSIRGAEHLEIESPHFKDSYVITGLEQVMEQSKNMCESFIEYQQVEAKEIDV